MSSSIIPQPFLPYLQIQILFLYLCIPLPEQTRHHHRLTIRRTQILRLRTHLSTTIRQADQTWAIYIGIASLTTCARTIDFAVSLAFEIVEAISSAAGGSAGIVLSRASVGGGVDALPLPASETCAALVFLVLVQLSVARW
jgi:hypothetical protein